MQSEISLGLIGVGKWGINYIKTIENIDKVNLKKIACLKPKNKLELFKNYELTDNWREITESSDIDGVIIATPPKSHFEIAKEAIQNKKPIILEKPITLSSSHANLLINLALKNKVLVKVNHVYLYHPIFRFLKNHISKRLDLISIYTLSGNYGPFRKDVSSLWDWAPHDLSMCLDLIGEMPLKIDSKFTKKSETNNFNSNININLRFKKNIYAELNIGNLMQFKERFLRLDFTNTSYIFDPIRYKYIQEKKNNLEYKEINQKKYF